MGAGADSSTISGMATAAGAFLGALDPGQRASATAALDDPAYREWTYLPGPRPGLALADMTARQREAALALVDSGCSAGGARTARAVIELDMIRRQLAGTPDPDDHRFWVRVFGTPAQDGAWAWRINGHHLAVHVAAVDGSIAVTPSFMGAEPAVVPDGPHQGLRTLPDEEELARTLLAQLDAGQRQVAITSDTAPHDILTRWDPVADPSALSPGLAHGAMTPEQQGTLEQLVRRYFDRAPLHQAERCWQEVLDSGIETVEFGWAGPDERGRGHYYAVRGPSFLIEYDNTQDDANHIHSVWRDLRHDWGGDLLAAHYRGQHR